MSYKSDELECRVWYDGMCMTKNCTVLQHEPLPNILWSVNHSLEDTFTAHLTQYLPKYGQNMENRMVLAQNKGQIWPRHTKNHCNLSLTAKENYFFIRLGMSWLKADNQSCFEPTPGIQSQNITNPVLSLPASFVHKMQDRSFHSWLT